MRALVRELVVARRSAGVSQAVVAARLGTSQSDISRLERLVGVDDVSFVRLCELGAINGLDLGAAFHPNGDRLIDRGHQALIARFVAVPNAAWRVAREVPFPRRGDRRSWDVLLRLRGQLVGVEAETRIRDVQLLVRRIRERERDGGVDHVLVVLSDSAVNRRLVAELREALGDSFATSPRAILKGLRTGEPIPGSGLVLV